MPKKTKDRSVAYPSVTLEDAIGLTRELMSKLGKGPYSREDAAKGLGHAALTGPAARKVAALVQYGFLERTGSVYALSQLAQDVLFPLDAEHELSAIGRAVQGPKLFALLIQRFQGQALPAMLESILIREKVSPTVAKDVADTFRASIKFAGILQNGVVLKQANPIPREQGQVSEVKDAARIEDAGGRIQEDLINSRQKGVHVFQFAGGVSLRIPSDPFVDEAILDGELKDIRKGLKDFSERYFIDGKS